MSCQCVDCPKCGAEVWTNDYLYVGNHAANDKGYEDSGFKIVGWRFHCRAELETGDDCGHIFETNVTGDLR